VNPPIGGGKKPAAACRDTAGVHIPHPCAYPIAGLKDVCQSKDYPRAFVPSATREPPSADGGAEQVCQKRA
jgi:hypothetical protein